MTFLFWYSLLKQAIKLKTYKHLYYIFHWIFFRNRNKGRIQQQFNSHCGWQFLISYRKMPVYDGIIHHQSAVILVIVHPFVTFWQTSFFVYISQLNIILRMINLRVKIKRLVFDIKKIRQTVNERHDWKSFVWANLLV